MGKREGGALAHICHASLSFFFLFLSPPVDPLMLITVSSHLVERDRHPKDVGQMEN